MSEFDLSVTTNRIIPTSGDYSKTLAEFPLETLFNIHCEVLDNLLIKHRINIKLDPLDVYANRYSDILMSKIALASWPLGKLIAEEMNFPITPDWLSYWELYFRCLYVSLGERMERVKQDNVRVDPRKQDYESRGIRRAVPIRSFHIHDNSGDSIIPLSKCLNKIEFNTGVSIKWDYVSTFTPSRTVDQRIMHEKNRQKWILGVDGNGKPQMNIRAWSNSLKSTIKVADIIVSNSADDTAYILAFTLLNLAPGGHAIIYIPCISGAGLISLIHLYRLVFTKCVIYHMLATDRIYVCGNDFLSIDVVQRKIILDWCDKGGSNISLFSSRYMDGDLNSVKIDSEPTKIALRQTKTGKSTLEENTGVSSSASSGASSSAKNTTFIDTVTMLIDISQAVYDWRYAYYEKQIILYIQLSKSSAAAQFNGYVAEKLTESYTDVSRKWTRITGFDFFKNFKELDE